MTNKLNSCSLWTHSHWAMWSYFISTEICVISTFSWSIDRDFLGIRFAKNSKKHSTNNKGKKKESSYLSRLDFEFSYGHWQQLQEKESSTTDFLTTLFSRSTSFFSKRAPGFGSVRHVCVVRYHQYTSPQSPPVSNQTHRLRWRHLIPLIKSCKQDIFDKILAHCSPFYCVFSHDFMAAIFVSQNNEMAASLCPKPVL